MTYGETIDYLFTRLPMFSRTGAAALTHDLSNTITLCTFLDSPHKKFKSIHIAGTNGKGSVSHMLAAVLQSAGYKTGLYTSPHLRDFRERIKVDGKMISEQFVIDFTQKTRQLSEKIRPSFFELSVAMAFDYFAQQKVDIAVIETGLGGRLDSTNIILPELSVITNIGRDHMNILGDSLEKIAGEKAGIIKPSVPVVVGEIIPQTRAVFEQAAKEKKAALFIAQEKRQALNWNWDGHELLVETSEKGRTDHKRYRLDLTGIYQVKNLLTVLEACYQLQQMGWQIDERALQAGLQHTKKMTGLHGRWEIVHHNPTIVLDVAHNVDGIRELVRQIEVTSHHRLHIIIGMVKDKEIAETLALLPPGATYYFTKAQIPRALPETELAGKALAADLKGDPFPDVNKAVRAALEHAHPDDLVIVCGSVYLVGEINTSIHPVSLKHTGYR